MAVSREWAEWHLTPRGWELGSTRRSKSGNQWATEPPDRVLTFVYSETRRGADDSPACKLEESWRISATEDVVASLVVNHLLQRFGPCHRSLG